MSELCVSTKITDCLSLQDTKTVKKNYKMIMVLNEELSISNTLKNPSRGLRGLVNIAGIVGELSYFTLNLKKRLAVSLTHMPKIIFFL